MPRKIEFTTADARRITCLLGLALGIFSATAQTTQLDSLVSVRFPDPPHFSDTEGIATWIWQTPDDSLLLVATRLEAQVSEEGIPDAASIATYYDGLIEGVRAAVNGRLVRQGDVPLDNLIIRRATIELSGDTLSGDGSLSAGALLLDGRVYLLQALSRADTATANAFVRSMRVAGDPAPTRQQIEAPFRPRRWVGEIVLIGALVIVILLGYGLVRWLR